MSYLVLARKWRPKTFDDIIGQDYITQTLKNAISTAKTAHAYIFSGPRGVGKTSTARILAKALNCEHGPTPDPCSKCPFCNEISEGKSLDVIEIDAASHTGVNDVREIIENIKYLPASGKNKIYIIDEVHMLSQSAFNALLKTLEEPPPHVLFILATTEVHKIPATIISRCQRYDFKKVPADQIREKLSAITTEEKINVPNETLYTVAQEADGSMRDALSLTDQLIATFGNDIEHDQAILILGILDRNLLINSIGAVFGKDPKLCIETLNNAIEKGISPKRFAEDILRTLRNTLLLKTCGSKSVPDLSEEDKKQLNDISKAESIETMEQLFNIMLEGAESIQRSFYPQMALEFTLIKLCTIDRVIPLDDIIKRIEKLSNSLGKEAPAPSRLEETKNTYTKESGPDPEPVTKHSTQNSGTTEFIEFTKSKRPVMYQMFSKAVDVTLDNSKLIITCAKNSLSINHFNKSDTQKNLKILLEEYFSEDISFEVVESTSAPSQAKANNREDLTEKKNKISNDSVLKDALDVFGGRVVSINPKQ